MDFRFAPSLAHSLRRDLRRVDQGWVEIQVNRLPEFISGLWGGL